MGDFEIVLVRHGESCGNVAREEAESSGADRISLQWRDPDTPLSELGHAQAEAAGAAIAELGLDQQPGAVWTSPYRRARDTAAPIAAACGLDAVVDERLRDRELGVLDGLTGAGVGRLFADEAVRRRWLGKLYYRPPGGESWADVALRIRSVLADLANLNTATRPVVLVTHDAVILLVRYVLERLDEGQLAELAGSGSVPNASITRLVRDSGGSWRAAMFSSVEHLDRHGVQATVHGGDHPNEH
jgi:broad specificity phosphatase PhoE